MADAIIRCNLEGAWTPIAPVWSLGIDGTSSGPDTATFVTTRSLPKYADVEILIGGLVVADGWIEGAEGMEDGELYTITVFCWQRHLDDDSYTRLYMRTGFAGATDGRDAPGVDMPYWYRAGLVMEERTLSVGIMPNNIFYSNQAVGATFDLGLADGVIGPWGGGGAIWVWLHLREAVMPPKLANYLYVRSHSERNNHHPSVPGQFEDATPYVVTGTHPAQWLSFAFSHSVRRYVTVFLTSLNTYDLDKDAPEWWMSFDDIRISTVVAGGGTANSLNGSTVTADQIVPHIVSKAPRLTLGANPVSAINMFSASTDGYQTPRQMLERINLDHWRYRVNPGRVLDRGPWPTLPTFTVSEEARSRLRHPETFTRVVVSYADVNGDRRSYGADVAGALRTRTQVIELENVATADEAGAVATAFLADQAQRTLEGTVTVAPGQVVERPSGQAIHPSQLLLAGGDRVYVDEAGDHARVVGMSYEHSTETITLDLSDVTDNLDKAMGLLDRPE